MTDNHVVLQLTDLTVSFDVDGTMIHPVRGVTLAIHAGERVALVGESGCGKSMSALSVTALPPTDRATIGGSVLLNGVELVNQPKAIAGARQGGVAYVFQDPSGALNPVMRIGDQIAEVLGHLPKQARQARLVELIEAVGLPEPQRMLRAYPCELSGGQQQRVMLAIALAMEPTVLIADEPTTALDVTTQRQILALMDQLSRARNMAVLLITHNLGIVAAYMDRVAVMYAGKIVETGSVVEVLKAPCHPYSRGLLAAVPTLAREQKVLQDIPGFVPAPGCFPAGCAFAPRCTFAQACCSADEAVPVRAVGVGHEVSCYFPQEVEA